MKPTPTQTPPSPHIRTRCDMAYIAQAETPDGLVKVGKSEQPNQRFTSVRQGVPFPLRLVAILLNGKAAEREMKERFATTRRKGEWFLPSPGMNDYLREAFKARTLVQYRIVDREYFERHLRPLLTSPSWNYNEPGDLCYRACIEGWPAVAGRIQKLIAFKSFTPELLRGYLPLDESADVPAIRLAPAALHVVVEPARAAE